MSLVNDMLRDLDARRRDAPARGIGAEKLVPASEHPIERTGRRKLLWMWLAVPLLLVVLVVGYLLFPRDSGQLPAVVLSPPTEPATQSGAAATATSTSQRSALNETVSTELAKMSARMRELEAQNQTLLRAQKTELSSPSDSLQTGNVAFEQDAWQPREWALQADAPAAAEAGATETDLQPVAETRIDTSRASSEPLTAQQQSPQQEVAPRESAGSTVRSPRDLSFSDTDRLRVQQALAQWNGGQQLAALQALDTFTYDFPEAHQSREMLAKLLIQQGESERAMQVVELGLTIAPRRNGYKKVKARLLLNKGQAAEAVTLLSSGRPTVSDDVEYHDLLATGLLSSAVYDEAAITYQSLLEIDERPGRWWYGLAASLDAQGRPQDAAQAYEQALRREDLSAALRQGSQQRLQAIRQASP